MDNHEFFVETYKPFDEYLKKHKYDPKTNTIEIDGKREPIKTKMSNKERNRVNKFLRENDYDPKTETIKTNVKDFTNKQKRIKFSLRAKDGAEFVTNKFMPGAFNEIRISPNDLKRKPYISNFIFKHEEGHFNDENVTVTKNNLEDWIDDINNALKGKDQSTAKQFKDKNEMKEALIYFQKQLNKFTSKENAIKNIKDKAVAFNDEQIKSGNLPTKTGYYAYDHDIDPRENYADLYAAKQNNYGKPSKNLKSSLYSMDDKLHRFANSKRATDNVEEQLSQSSNKNKAKNDILDYLKKFKNPGVVAHKLGLGKNLTENDINSIFKLHDDCGNIIDKRRSYVDKNPEIIDIRSRMKELAKAGEVESDEYWALVSKEKELKKSLVNEYKKNNAKETDMFDKNKEAEEKFMDNFFNGLSNKELSKIWLKVNYNTPKYESGIKSRQDFVNSINEMYLSNIITESEYIQLQERIQILTERSEIYGKCYNG